MKVPLVTAFLNGLIKAIKALNCKCRSTCCDSECTQKQPRQSDVKVRIEDYSERIGKIEKTTDL